MLRVFSKIISNRKVLVFLYVLISIIVTLQILIIDKRNEERTYSKYNNYTIFKHSYEHLTEFKDLYIEYPQEHWDLYKYTPTFSVFFAAFYNLPDWLGLSIWNLLNALILLISIYWLPHLSNYKKGLILLLIVIELVTSIQNAQSNALLAGLLILSFGFLERNRPFWAAFFIAFCVYIKLFGIVGFVLFLFYPSKLKSLLSVLFWMLIFAFIPLLVVDIGQYEFLIRSYLNMLSNDHSSSLGYSLMGVLHAWFHIGVNKALIVIAGATLFLLPCLKVNLYKEIRYKYLMLCSLLIWIVIFNHKAESPTFIISLAGIAIWFVTDYNSKWRVGLIIFALLITSFSTTDIFPKSIKDDYFKPYFIKALPSIMIWFYILYQLLCLKIKPLEITEKQ